LDGKLALGLSNGFPSPKVTPEIHLKVMGDRLAGGIDHHQVELSLSLGILTGVEDQGSSTIRASPQHMTLTVVFQAPGAEIEKEISGFGLVVSDSKGNLFPFVHHLDQGRDCTDARYAWLTLFTTIPNPDLEQFCED
jgi:hypothetical protein